MKPILDWSFLLLLAACTHEQAMNSPQEPSSQPSASKGILHGAVTIGPLHGPVPPGKEPEIDWVAVCASRKIIVRAADGETEVATLDIDPKTRTYRTELAPGSYVVDCSRGGMDSGKDLPKTVEIAAGKSTQLDVEIDTGVR